MSIIPAGPRFDLTSTFADLNGDGVADIVDTSDSGSIFVTLGRADGTFLDRRESSPHVAFPTAVHAADVDGDGHADLLVSDFRATSIDYLPGDGAGNFSGPMAIDAGGPVNDFKIADVNGDGRPDIVTVNDDHSVSVMINLGPCRPPRHRAVRR